MAKSVYVKLAQNQSIRNGALFSIFSFINKGFAFILLIIMANMMSPAEYGYLNLFNTVVMVIGCFIALSSEGYLSVAYFRNGERGIGQTFSSILLLSNVVAVFLFAIILIGGDKVAYVLNLPYHTLWIAITICFFTVFNNIVLDVWRIREKVVIYGLFSCGCALCNFLLSIVLIKFANAGWISRAYAQMLCAMIFGGYGLYYFISRKYFTKDIKESIKPLLIWSFPLIPHTVTNFIRQGCDRYIINHFHSIDDVGYFSFALTLVNVITMIGFGFNQSNSVDIYKTLGNPTILSVDKVKKLAKQRHLILEIYAVTTIIVVAVASFTVPYIMPKYGDSIKYFMILSVYGFGICVYLLYTNYLFYYRKTRLIMYITFGSALLHLGLSLFLTRYNLLYTAVLYGITQMVIVLLIRNRALNIIDKDLR